MQEEAADKTDFGITMAFKQLLALDQVLSIETSIVADLSKILFRFFLIDPIVKLVKIIIYSVGWTKKFR